MMFETMKNLKLVVTISFAISKENSLHIQKHFYLHVSLIKKTVSDYISKLIGTY